jgi:hypothetical protein
MERYAEAPERGNSIKPGVKSGNPWSSLKKSLEPIPWAIDCVKVVKADRGV